MKISVVMSAYNNQETVSRAIESILSQDFRDFEFIIVNDGSSDNTLEIIKECQKKDKRIILINQQNLGLTKSLNIALKSASGEYIARQDADDISFLSRLKKQAAYLDENNKIGFAGCNFNVLDQSNNFLERISIPVDPKIITKTLKHKNLFCHGSMMFRNSLLKEIGGYRDFFEYGQDYDLYLRLIEITLPGSVREVLYCRSITLDGVSVSKARVQNAYGQLARKCEKVRKGKLDDKLLLNRAELESCMQGLDFYDFAAAAINAFYCLENNEAFKAREVMKEYLPGFSIRKWKLYSLYLFSYLPGFLRSPILRLRMALRIR